MHGTINKIYYKLIYESHRVNDMHHVTTVIYFYTASHLFCNTAKYIIHSRILNY